MRRAGVGDGLGHRRVEELARHLGRQITQDLFTGRRTASVESTIAASLNRNRSPGRRRTGRQCAWDEATTFLAVCMARVELAEIKRRAAARGLSAQAYARLALGLPARRPAP